MGLRVRVIPPRWRELIGYYAGAYNIPSQLIESLISNEGWWNPTAVSSAGACGLMQVMPFHWGESYCKPYMLEVEENMRMGAGIARGCLERSVEVCGHPDIQMTAVFYLGGPRATDTCSVPLWYNESQRRYCFNVANDYNWYLHNTVLPGIWALPDSTFYADVTWENTSPYIVDALITVAYGINPITTPPYLDGIGVSSARSEPVAAPGMHVTRVPLTMPPLSGLTIGQVWEGVAIVHYQLTPGEFTQVAASVSPQYLYVADNYAPWRGKL